MPDTMLDSAVITSAVRLASRAPSLHNTQPWRLVADGAGLHLHLDPSRVVTATDRSAREAIISCGVLLDHVRVAMAAAGWATSVDRFPNPNDLDHLATLQFEPMDFVTEAHRRRADAILTRHTDRLPMAGYPDWDAFEPLLRARLANGSVHLDVLTDDMRADVAEAAALTESLRLYDSAYHAELTWWTTPFATEDGIPQSSLVSAAESERVAVSRTFPVTAHSDRRTAVHDDSATLVVLSTDGYSRADALDAGEALSALLLECTMSGLGTCPVSHVTELHASRDIIGALINRDACPQLLVRIGIAPTLTDAPPPTPRRSVDAFVTFE
ncbi:MULTISPECIES: Acg family FMN-binding oxidoreductase [unclassified Mycolicibacterium]|uniref:Acg family FMN-binding oxidoreductase n=1 Tax=unclassified Mycolicibacterium TaxID=2636767 RepID=UPI0012DD914B|nr:MULTISPECIES: NAD(P)H nitroreductase [unclassified Mycolicibacterium]MUL85133.1 NAD(P)H nitroreductase [Mycolicibacterium sp. CBMA 329]MUL91100.1 NAD(P)H nitroreductase [Mycolicibacterium sp. CBMA 331]MUL98229.1 NAD(P)H nitroreductase [Mycolicibacterium sp. CBMA 334]MUM26110.1 NAD(P)H nitroreductase [Mycolicibacterium sp. CBMA 295]MUM40859.1 NAD(P)H nitroreductase [Mycolicibacterium sp. CBMA 247]